MAWYQLDRARRQEVDFVCSKRVIALTRTMEVTLNYWVTSDLAMGSTLSFSNDRFYDYGV